MIETTKKKTVMLPIRVPRLEGTKSLRYLPRRVVQAMADHASANLLLGERTVPGRFVVYRLVADEIEREELERQFAESQATILQDIAREARAREFRLRGDLAVRLRTVLPAELKQAGGGPVDRAPVDVPPSVEETGDLPVEPGGETGEAGPCPAPLLSVVSRLSAVDRERLEAERELILPERLRTVLVESRPAGAAVYLDDRQQERVTPCRVLEVPAGRHTLSLALPGFVPYETGLEVPEEEGGEIRVTTDLRPEPPMGVLEVVTFPSQATVTVETFGAEEETVSGLPSSLAAPITRTTPARLRLPAGRVRARIEHPDYESRQLEYALPSGGESAPGRLQVRLQYAGDDREVPVGRLVVYKPFSGGRAPVDPRPLDRPEDTIASFFQDRGVDLDGTPQITMAEAPPAEPEVLGERPLYKGVLLIGREDRHALVTPDVKLFDPANTVSRGCHAWLHVYTDPGTGAEYNTFVIHSHSPSGILVNGRLIMESAALGDDAEIEIGIFRMRILKEMPQPRVEF
jgi:hypothetical protein